MPYIVGGTDYGTEEACNAAARREMERIRECEMTVERRLFPIIVELLVDAESQVRCYKDERSERLLARMEATAARAGIEIVQRGGQRVPFERELHRWAGAPHFPQQGDDVMTLTPALAVRGTDRVLRKALVGSVE